MDGIRFLRRGLDRLGDVARDRDRLRRGGRRARDRAGVRHAHARRRFGRLGRHRHGDRRRAWRSGWSSANAASRVIERHIVFVWSLFACGGALVAFAATPTLAYAAVDRGLARGVLRARLGERLHPAAGERGRRVPRPDVRRAHDALARGPVPVARGVPGARPGVRRRRRRPWFGGEFFVGGQRFDLSGSRLALWLAAAVLGGRGLHDLALARAIPSVAARAARARAETQTTTRHRTVHRLRRRRGRGQGHPGRDGGAVPAPTAGTEVLVTREPGGHRPPASASASCCSTRRPAASTRAPRRCCSPRRARRP